MPSSTSSSEAGSSSFYPVARTALRPWAIAVMLAVMAGAAFVGDRVIALGCEKLVLASRFRFSRLYADAAAADVLIFGNSRAVNTFYTPEIEGACKLSALNLGYNGCSTELAAAMLDDWLERKPPPKIIVVEVSSLLDGNELLKSLKMYAGVAPRIVTGLAAYSPPISRSIRFTHLYRFNTEMFLRALYYVGRDDQTWINRYTIGEALLDRSKAQASIPLPLPQPPAVNLDAVVRIRDICKDRGITLVLVLGPYSPLYRQRLTNIEDWVASIEAALDAPVADFSRAIKDHSCFSDHLHMNARGASELFPAVKRLLDEALPQAVNDR